MVSFSLPSKAQPPALRSTRSPTGPGDDDEEEAIQNNREYITEFDSSESPADTSKIPKNFVIPPIPNQWNPQHRQFNTGSNPALQFDVDSSSSSIDAAADSIAFGLNLRSNDNNSLPADPVLQKLREDLARLPDDNNDYKEVPVEGYGNAILAGYGWREGRGIGLNAKEDVKVAVFKHRSGREGLGYTPTPGAELTQEVPPFATIVINTIPQT